MRAMQSKRRQSRSFRLETLEERTLLSGSGSQAPIMVMNGDELAAAAATAPAGATIEIDTGEIFVSQAIHLHDVTLEGDVQEGGSIVDARNSTTGAFIFNTDSANATGGSALNNLRIVAGLNSTDVVNQAGSELALANVAFYGRGHGAGSTGDGVAFENDGIATYSEGLIEYFDNGEINTGALVNTKVTSLYNDASGVLNSGNFTDNNPFDFANEATDIVNNGGVVTVNGGQILECDGPYKEGSAFTSTGGGLSINGAMISGSVGDYAVYVAGGTLSISGGSQLRDNSIAVDAVNATVNITASAISGNASFGAGVVYFGPTASGP